MSPVRFMCRRSRNKVRLWLLLTVSGMIVIVLHDVFNAVTTTSAQERGSHIIDQDSIPVVPPKTAENRHSMRLKIGGEVGEEDGKEAEEEEKEEEKEEEEEKKEEEKEEEVEKKEEEKEEEEEKKEKEKEEEEEEKEEEKEEEEEKKEEEGEKKEEEGEKREKEEEGKEEGEKKEEEGKKKEEENEEGDERKKDRGERKEVEEEGEMGNGGGGDARERKESTIPRRPIIVYSCNLLSVCGGWADRQKGVVSAYLLSAMLDTPFKLDMPRPCDVTTYLVPNEVDWKLKPGEAERGRRSDVEGLDSHGYDLVRQMLLVDDLQMPQLRADYVFITWNMELVHLLRAHPLAGQVSWLAAEMSIAEIYHYVLNKLFTPVASLRTTMSSLQNARPLGTKLACAQIRLGGSPKFPDTQTFNVLTNVQKVIDYLSVYNDPSRYMILFASDNVEALKMAQTAFPQTFMETSGPITHVDRHHGQDACAGMGRAILDQLMLSTCDVLVISESGLGKIAAFLRNTDRDLFLFHDSQVSVFRRDLPFPTRIFW